MELVVRFFLSIVVIIYGTLISAIVLSLASIQPETFLDVLVPWLCIGFLLLMLPKRVGGAILVLCHVAMVGSIMVGVYFVGANVVAYFQEEPDKVCSYDCDQPIPDTSDLIDSVTPTGDNNHSPGTHNVEGHFRGGTYIAPYTRSNPDGDPTNNLNE